MHLTNLPAAVFCRIGESLPSNADRANLAMACRGTADMMEEYTWTCRDYEGLVPHRLPPHHSQGWLELNKERARLRKRRAVDVLSSCRSYLKKGKPEKVLALIAPQTPELHLYHGCVRQALQMQGRGSESLPLDAVVLRRQEFERALREENLPNIKMSLEAGAELDRTLLVSMPGITRAEFWPSLCPMLHALGRIYSLNAIACHTLTRTARTQALSFLAPASDMALETMMRRGGSPEEMQAVLSHAIVHHLHDWQAQVMKSAVLPPDKRRWRPAYAEVLAGACPSAEAILLVEGCNVGGSLFHRAQANRQLNAGEIDRLYCALIGIYRRADIQPVESAYQTLTTPWRRSERKPDLLERPEAPRPRRLGLEEVILHASPSILAALAAAGYRISTKDVLRELFVPSGALSKCAKLRMLNLKRSGLWVHPSASQFDSAIVAAGQQRESLLSLII